MGTKIVKIFQSNAFYTLQIPLVIDATNLNMQIMNVSSNESNFVMHFFCHGPYCSAVNIAI